MNPTLARAIAYLEKKLGAKLYALPEETFKNSRETGRGVRVIVGGTMRAFRINYNASGITGIDIWNGSTRDPNAHIAFEGNVDVAKVFPVIIQNLKAPNIGEEDFVVVESVNGVNRVITEAAKKWTPETLVQTAVTFIQRNSDRVGKAALAGITGFANAGVLDIIMEMYPDAFQKQGRGTVFVGDIEQLDIAEIINVLKDRTVHVSVERGGANETYGETEGEKAIPEEDKRIPYEDQLRHMEALIKATVKGASNALFIAGAGGVGKTHTVEKVLAELGLKDGEGYYKQTGSSSAIGVYATLFNNRDGIVLFDDCDGALADQDARNVIKAATDTKKERKLAWGKRSSMMYDPEQEDDIDPDDIGVEKFPRFYFFKGRIIFISNLPIDKLDPDGALRTRAFMVDINPTRDELLDFMEKIVHKIPLDDGLTLDKEGREAVVRAIRADKRSSGLSIRKLVRSMNLAATGVENWEELVALYC